MNDTPPDDTQPDETQADDTQADDLAPKPEATTVKPQLQPGGADALPGATEEEAGLGRDLPPDLNPATEEVPEAITEPDDKPQAPTGGADHEADSTQEDPSAGQVAEDGSPEPPA